MKSLTGIALQNWGSEQSYDAIAQMHGRGSSETLALVQKLSKSKNWRKRALGLTVAAQLREAKAWAISEVVEYAVVECQSMLLAGLEDAHADVLCAAISGLGHRPLASALPKLLQFLAHEDSELRYSLAFTLGHYSDNSSVDALMLLAKDTDSDVRDWATFSLGSMLEVDNLEMREVLWSNLNDVDENVRGEALVGLASRRDQRIISVLQKCLTTDCRVYELEAAEMMASPLLLDQLSAIESSLSPDDGQDRYWRTHLRDAIKACTVSSESSTMISNLA